MPPGALSPAMNVLRLGAIACALLVLGGCSDAEVDPPQRAETQPSGTLWEQLGGSTASGKAEARDLARAFPVFRSSQEAPPPKVRAHLERTLRAPRADFAIQEAQELEGKRGELWLIQVGSVVCLIDEATGALSCTPADEFETRGLSLGIVGSTAASSGSRFSTMGLVPARVRRVVVKAGPDRRVLEVRRGLYFASSDLPVLVRRYCEGDAGSCRPVPLGSPGK